MDLLTHALFAYSISSSIRKSKNIFLYSLLIGALAPDIGEIVIQRELSDKFGEAIAVYDERTSDADVAADLNVTYLYDALHSLVLPIGLLLWSLAVKRVRLKLILRFFSIGLISHVFLDSFTHGKVWALKLFFPITNERFVILSESIGNWWDWTPKIGLFYLKLPIYCVILWITLIFYNLIRKRIEERTERLTRDSPNRGRSA